MVLLPLVAFALMLILWRRQIPDWRVRFTIAAMLWAVGAVVLTETLSELTDLTPIAVAAGWVMISLAIMAATPFVPAAPPRDSNTAARGQSRILIGEMVLLAAVLGLVAWIGPPNNSDSMTYHLPRVFHWIEDRNVAFYPCNSPRQIEMAPGAEYLILQFQILSANDRWADMVQWFAYVGCIVAVSLLTRSLGGSPRAQILAAVVMAAIPMACLEAETTQNDLVSALWFTCFLIFFFKLCDRSDLAARGKSPARPDEADVDRGLLAARLPAFLLCGLALGLGVLTKSTLFIFAAPFGGILASVVLFRLRWRGAAGLAALLLVAITLNLPTFVRNYRFTHTITGNGGFGPHGNYYANADHGPGAIACNILRNVAMEFTVQPASLRRGLEDAVRRAAGWVGNNADDPSTLFFGEKFDLGNMMWNGEDYAPSPGQVLLFAAAVVTLILMAQHPPRRALLLASGLLADFILFCAYLRWQPWNNRLHLPLLVAASAVTAVAIDRHWNARFSAGVAVVLPLFVLPWVVLAANHPLIGDDSIFRTSRTARYFDTDPCQVQCERIVAAAVANRVKQVAILGDGDTFEYPLDHMLSQKIPGVLVEAYYPYKSTCSPEALHTNNRGFNPDLKPYLLVDMKAGQCRVNKIVR